MYAELSDAFQCGMDTVYSKLFICAQQNFVLPFINRVLFVVIFLISSYTSVSLADPMILKMVICILIIVCKSEFPARCLTGSNQILCFRY